MNQLINVVKIGKFLVSAHVEPWLQKCRGLVSVLLWSWQKITALILADL